MSAEQIDQLLVAWDERLRRVDESLLALEGEPTYQMLAGLAGKRAPLEGVTRARVSPALDALAELFEHRERLTEVLDRAKEVRKNVGFFDKEQKLAEVVALLQGPSIKMGTTPKPLAQRNLLDPASNDVAVVPEQLLAAMAQAYEGARDAVMAVSRAWAVLEPAMERLEQDLGSLKKLAEELDEMPTVGAEVAGLERDLAAYRRLVAKDPLGVSESLASSLEPRLAAVRDRLQGLAAAKVRVTAGLRAADAIEHELAEAHAAAQGIAERTRAEFGAVAIPAPVSEELMLGLSEWRRKIAATAHAGRWQSADVGLSRWQEVARAYLAGDVGVTRALDALIANRAELSGRFSARRAQLAALVARGAARDPSLEERAREAEALLMRRPTPMEQAARVIEGFEAGVVALASLAGKARKG